MAAEVIKLYQDENVEPLQNMTRYAAIDYNLLATKLAKYTNIDYNFLISALADEMERRQKAEQAQKKAAKAEASVKRRTTVGANGTVDPIRKKEDILKIAQYFYDKGQLRNAAMFIIGCNRFLCNQNWRYSGERCVSLKRKENRQIQDGGA